MRKSKIVVGQEFGNLVVLERAEQRGNSFSGLGDKKKHIGTLFWVCRCKCGRIKPIRSQSLLCRRSRSCGCKGGQAPLPLGRAARNEVYAKYRVQAKQRGFAWNITENEFDVLILGKCHYCGIPPSNHKKGKSPSSGDLVYSGIDRKDNSRGYEKDNVVACCIDCNRLKGKMAYDRFVAWLGRVTAYRSSLATERDVAKNEQLSKP